jgi:hypothetical protein
MPATTDAHTFDVVNLALAAPIEMLNKRGVCALHLKIIAAAAGVSVGTAREAIMIADTIDLVTVEHLRGFYDIRSRSPEWLSALFQRERISGARSPLRPGCRRLPDKDARDVRGHIRR